MRSIVFALSHFFLQKTKRMMQNQVNISVYSAKKNNQDKLIKLLTRGPEKKIKPG